jgi:methionine synthase II (cobalamin-independent)
MTTRTVPPFRADHVGSLLRPPELSLRVTTHLCRGNFRSSWVAEGGYDFVAETAAEVWG